MRNTQWYNIVGNVGFIGYSPAYVWEDQKAFFEEACAFMGKQSGVDLLMLQGHWNKYGAGTEDAMDMKNGVIGSLLATSSEKIVLNYFLRKIISRGMVFDQKMSRIQQF